MSERELLNDIRLEASKIGARLFRNNVGTGWAGRLASHRGSAVTLLSARPLHAGLCVGSSDLIGFIPVTITADMVGTTLARFVAIEGKTGRLTATDEQRAFLGAVEAAGGVAVVARNTDEALRALGVDYKAKSVPAEQE